MWAMVNIVGSGERKEKEKQNGKNKEKINE